MVIKSLYSKYFQKSKSFLYPALGIKKSSKFNPLGTYISVKDCIGPEDIKLICTFSKDESESFLAFEQEFLIGNPLYIKKVVLDNYLIYIFDFHIYEQDWFNFILGKYSKISSVLKRAIEKYYVTGSSEHKFVDSYLNPTEYFENYSKLLDINIQFLKETGELCDPCNIEKETLVIPENYLEELKKDLNL